MIVVQQSVNSLHFTSNSWFHFLTYHHSRFDLLSLYDWWLKLQASTSISFSIFSFPSIRAETCACGCACLRRFVKPVIECVRPPCCSRDSAVESFIVSGTIDTNTYSSHPSHTRLQKHNIEEPLADAAAGWVVVVDFAARPCRSSLTSALPSRSSAANQKYPLASSSPI